MIILAAIVQAMMGLGLALPIEHRSSAGSAPAGPVTGNPIGLLLALTYS